MKIALYMTTVLEHGGGMEKYLIETASRFANEPGIECDVITMDSDFTNKISSMLSVFYFKKIDKKLNFKEDLNDIQKRLGKAQYFKMRTIAELRSKLQDYDVIYSKNELLESALFKFAIGFKSVPPIIYGGHTPIQYPHPESFHARLHNFLYGGFIYRYLAGSVRKFHVLNNYEREQYSRIFEPERVAKIYNPFDLKRFKDNASKYPQELDSLSDKSLKVLWVGRLTEQKGVHDLIRIITKVNDEAAERSVEWSIVGDGEEKADVVALEKKYENVHYYGHIDQKHMASVYKQHHVFLGTSKWEGYPYTLIEAQAYGLRIYAYDIPGVNDILSVYDGGHLQANIDEMELALKKTIQGFAADKTIDRASATDQFEPDKVYQQLLSMMQAVAT